MKQSGKSVSNSTTLILRNPTAQLSLLTTITDSAALVWPSISTSRPLYGEGEPTFLLIYTFRTSAVAQELQSLSCWIVSNSSTRALSCSGVSWRYVAYRRASHFVDCRQLSLWRLSTMDIFLDWFRFGRLTSDSVFIFCIFIDQMKEIDTAPIGVVGFCSGTAPFCVAVARISASRGKYPDSAMALWNMKFGLSV